ncbi:MAG TPA: alpha/beta hydrolase [Solirubrobacteraceae bacterium]|nr:alpha/beta hydrolase [Solirubrobacteraceae bacterium]
MPALGQPEQGGREGARTGRRADVEELRVQTDDGVWLFGQRAGTGPAIVLLHGLTATRRYIVMGSRGLERGGLLVLAYDARGHGRSSPAPDANAYGYERLTRDLEELLDGAGIERAVIAGASMGAHTAVRFALERPARVAALGLITPAYDPSAPRSPDAYAHWDALAAGLREGGVEGFLAAYDFDGVPAAWRETVAQVMRQRLSAHEHPLAVADALEVVPRSRPFESFEQLAQIAAPTLVIASRDEADPSHPLIVGERYAQAIPGARLLVEEPGSSPLAWQGGRLSNALLELTVRASQA